MATGAKLCKEGCRVATESPTPVESKLESGLVGVSPAQIQSLHCWDGSALRKDGVSGVDGDSNPKGIYLS